jgi:uncharacterized protein (DUF4415 family)
MKGEPIAKRVPADRKKDRTDWARVRAMTEEEVDRRAERDPDNPAWTPQELAAARLIAPSAEPKVPVSIRLDREVVDYFKGQGPGYQSRIGAVLLAYVRSQEHNAAG